MKVIVADIKEKYMIGLTQKGDFIKIKKDNNLTIGSEIELSEVPRFSSSSLHRFISIAAVFIFILGITVVSYGYYRPYNYVDIDINPSIEITSNIFDRIIKIEGLNDDGKKVLLDLSLKNSSVESGVNVIIAKSFSLGYIKSDKINNIVVSVSGESLSNSTKIEKQVAKKIFDTLHKKNVKTNIKIEKSDMNKHKKAKQLGISTAKFNEIEHLKTDPPSIKADKHKKMPLKEKKEILNGVNKNNTHNNKVSDSKDSLKLRDVEKSKKNKEDNKGTSKQTENESEDENDNDNDKKNNNINKNRSNHKNNSYKNKINNKKK